jgi:hypothetical protein
VTPAPGVRVGLTPHPVPETDANALPSITTGAKIPEVRRTSPDEIEDWSPTPGSTSIHPARRPDDPQSRSSSRAPSISRTPITPLSPTPENFDNQTPVVKASDERTNEHLERRPVPNAAKITGTSVADALAAAFTGNAQQIQTLDFRPKQRRPLIMSIVPMKARSSSSSTQTRPQTEQRQSYFRRSKELNGYAETRKGRTLDQDELEELLDADVVDVVYDSKLGVNVSDHVRRSNLRHALGVVHSGEPELDANRREIRAEEGPTHLPPRFAKFTVSRGDRFLEMLESTFGPDSHRGGGPKPRLVSPSSLTHPSFVDTLQTVISAPVSEDSRAISPNEKDENESGAEEGPTHGLVLGKRKAMDDDTRKSKRPRVEELKPTPLLDQELAITWVILFHGLVKGKAKMNHEVESELMRWIFAYAFH